MELKCPDRLVAKYKPLICHFRQWIYKHFFLILAVILGVCHNHKNCEFALFFLKGRCELFIFFSAHMFAEVHMESPSAPVSNE